MENSVEVEIVVVQAARETPGGIIGANHNEIVVVQAARETPGGIIGANHNEIVVVN